MRSTHHPPAIIQLGKLKTAYPDGHITWRAGALTWTGLIQPTASSRVYTVSIVWRRGRRAEVSVIDPPLSDSPDLPHVFPGKRLCLHLNDEWHSRTPITDTVIPWTAEWLLFYELWEATGLWLGGGHEPAKNTSAHDTVVAARGLG